MYLGPQISVPFLEEKKPCILDLDSLVNFAGYQL